MSSVFLNSDEIFSLQREHGSPLFVYDEASLQARAREVLAFPNAFGLTARYAMKALPNAAIVRSFREMGICIDVSSGFEAERALRAGVPGDAIQLTAQELPADLSRLVGEGIRFNACSLHQLESFGRAFPGRELSVRINPGLGSGHVNRTNTGGPASSFGIWHERLDEVKAIAAEHDLQLTRMHTHIGSGSEPSMWVHCAKLSLDVAARLPDVRTINLGGGFKVARMPDDNSADLQEIGQKILPEFERFASIHGRELHLEVEPGSYLVATAGLLLARVEDVVDTGPEGYQFIKLDSGMTEILRPSMYGAQHPFSVIPADGEARSEQDYVIVGHCCESGDVLSPEPGNAEALLPRRLLEARRGDAFVIGGVGAYCSSMSAVNYNSVPACAEVLKRSDGSFQLIRRRQSLDEILQTEL
jgi:diaminopimelate decarboxylase